MSANLLTYSQFEAIACIMFFHKLCYVKLYITAIKTFFILRFSFVGREFQQGCVSWKKDGRRPHGYSPSRAIGEEVIHNEQGEGDSI